MGAPANPVAQLFSGIPAPEPRSLIERLRNLPRPDLAEQGLKVLLATCDLAKIREHDILEIHKTYGLDETQMRQVHTSIWRQIVAAFVDDGLMDPNQASNLDSLCLLLDISFDDADKAQEEIVLPKFKQILAGRYIDPINDDTVPNQLREIAAGLRVPEEKQRQVLKEIISIAINHRVAQIEESKRIANDEYERINALALAHAIDLDVETKGTLVSAS